MTQNHPEPILAGRYRVLSKLGEGAMGAVYLGEHLRMGRRDAIKVISRTMAGNPEAIARFAREARNASFINHPNVCQIYDFGETEEGLAFLAMEFVEGETLTDLLQRSGGVLPPLRAIRIAIQVADALDAAHGREIVHRDLKLDNIMITRSREGGDMVKVVDFGIAKGIGEDEGQAVTRLGFVIGTPEYMSPEQLAGDRLDGRSDLYSLGLVLYRMLTGTFPFTGETAQELMLRRLTEDPRPLALSRSDLSFPAGLQSVLDRLLQRNAADRPSSARELRRELRALLPPGESTGEQGAVPTGEARAGGIAPAARMGAGGAGPAEGTGSPAGSSGREGETGVGGAGGRGSSRTLILAGGGAAAALIVLLVLILGRGGGGEEGAPIEAGPSADASGAGGAANIAPAGVMDGPGEGESEGASGSGAGGTGASPGDVEPAGRQPMAAGDRAGADPGAGASPGTGAGETPPAPTVAPPIRILPAVARVIAARQQGAFDDALDAAGVLFPDEVKARLRDGGPGAARIRAVMASARDTLEAVWANSELSPSDRAYAAFVLGVLTENLPAAAPGEIARWFGRAVELDPGNGSYRASFEAYRGGGDD